MLEKSTNDTDNNEIKGELNVIKRSDDILIQQQDSEREEINDTITLENSYKNLSDENLFNNKFVNFRPEDGQLMLGSELDDFFENFIDNLHTIEDPRIYIPFITNHFNTANTFHVSQTLFHLIRNYNVDYPPFHSGLLEILTEETLEKYNTLFLSFLKLVLCNDNVSLGVIMAFIKKLARIALNVSSQRAYEILHFLFIVMRYYPICFEMVHSKSYVKREWKEIKIDDLQEYLFEFDVLQCGVQPIRDMVLKIRKYRVDKKSRIDRRNYLDEGYGRSINRIESLNNKTCNEYENE